MYSGGMARESRSVWARRVERWNRSGLTAAEFAALVGVKEATLRHWKWQLRHGVDKAISVSRPKFIEVLPQVRELAMSQLEVVIGDARVVVPVGFDEDTLRRLLRVVAE